MSITPPRLRKPMSINQMRAKISASIETSFDILVAALKVEKTAYKAAKDLIDYEIALQKLEMQKELHDQQIRLLKFKNTIEDEKVKATQRDDSYRNSSQDADVSNSTFSLDIQPC